MYIYIYIYILYAARDPAALVLAAVSLKAGLNAESSLACFGLLAWWFLREGRRLGPSWNLEVFGPRCPRASFSAFR